MQRKIYVFSASSDLLQIFVLQLFFKEYFTEERRLRFKLSFPEKGPSYRPSYKLQRWTRRIWKQVKAYTQKVKNMIRCDHSYTQKTRISIFNVIFPRNFSQRKRTSVLSSVSMKSDKSMDYPLNIEDGCVPHTQSELRINSNRSEKTVFTCVFLILFSADERGAEMLSHQSGNQNPSELALIFKVLHIPHLMTNYNKDVFFVLADKSFATKLSLMFCKGIKL